MNWLMSRRKNLGPLYGDGLLTTKQRGLPGIPGSKLGYFELRYSLKRELQSNERPRTVESL